MKKTLLSAFAGLAMVLGATLGGAPAEAAGGAKPPSQDWSWSGPFGTFDRASLRRGLQVYAEVCASCHGVHLVAYRNLMDIGFSEDEVKAFASEYEVEDGPDEEGEMYMRAARPADRFVSPFANDNAARASNNGALPPDLSLMTKARVGGADYVYALLTGYEEEAPEGIEVLEGMSYNHFFPGNQIAMAPPIDDDSVEYADGTVATKEQISKDIVTFLTWTAEPEMEQRKRLGIKVLIFLVVFTGLLYALKRRIWADLH